jgi:hypothetical protein
MVMLKNLDLDAKDFGFLQSVLLLWSGSGCGGSSPFPFIRLPCSNVAS